MKALEEELMRLAHENPRFIIERYFSVINKDKEVVPFLFNDLQNQFYEERTTRDDILKPGQIGFSTMILAILTVKFLFIPNAWCVCISHQEKATERLFEKVKFFLDNLPPQMKQFLDLGKDTAGELINKRTNSRFYVGTAGARAFGRGDTIHYAHFSEISRWRNPEVATGVLRAVPVHSDETWIVKETTANGVGNFHHEEYQKAKNHKSKFKSHFFPWFDHKEYQIPVSSLWMPDDEEDAIMRAHPQVTPANLEWRRQMIKSLVSEGGFTPEDIFKQEFPMDDVEAFLFSGNPVFPPKKLQEYDALVKPPVFIGNLEGISPNESLDETEKGYIKIYDMPSSNGQYVIFADVGQYTDYCSAHVLDKKTWKVMATFHAQIKSSHFGSELNKLGHFYNKALLAIEDNNMGQSTIDRCIELNYPNLYKRQRFNKVNKTITNEVGFHTDGKTKPLIIGYMQDLVRTSQVPFIDRETLDEMKTFVRKDDGSMEASAGNNDDRVISFMGAYFILKTNPYIRSNKVKPQSERPAKAFKAMRTPKRREGRMTRFR